MQNDKLPSRYTFEKNDRKKITYNIFSENIGTLSTDSSYDGAVDFSERIIRVVIPSCAVVAIRNVSI